ncbi:uncharacterized protein EDB91DRAFT_1251662 [Suillus paluster]|uniref:uncharacterized protein n=1 Tax=Suillus paluster TaxID=48578 RepID=UPI001B877257|nr:uncharacterized protein EDB91DRAFT_1251662 [Suillus paluster]KAG1732614.1 hypothetical protein EDB91DRAFT_1251662 [Suillus paluster]
MPAQCAGSPKKHKTKHKAADSDLGKTLVEAMAKRWQSQADASPPVQPPRSIPDLDVADNSNLRRTNRAGAGKGGRNSQLERISALLDAPGWATKPKGSTTLDSNAPVNPLAPVPPSKGCGSRSKAPPPYSASQPAVDSSAPPSRKQGKKAKNIAAFASSIKVPNQPNFVQCEDGEHFGFHPPIVPSRMEQVLNTSSITAKSASQKPATSTSIDTLSQSDFSKTTSVNTMPHSQADFYSTLDPSLQPICQEAQGETNYRGAPLLSFSQEAQAEVSTSGDDKSSTDDADKSDTDEESDNDDGEIGWGGDHGCHSVHPSFLKEGISVSQPQAITLPSDFEFQHSRDEDENVALGLLAVDKTSNSNDVMDGPTKPEDVLQGHHKKNGCPCLPDPTMLDLIWHQETQATNAKSHDSGVKAKKVKSSKSKEPTEGPKPTQLSWYPSQWKTFLEEAKSECHAQYAIENAFPDAIKDLPLSVTEALSMSLVKWLEAGNEVEAGIWPDHKADMAKLLYEDLSTWCSDLKKIAISTSALHNCWMTVFLRNSVDELGKTNNAAHPALKAAAIAFFYTGSYCIAHRRPNIFKEELPLESLAFYNCVFDGLVKNGSGKYFPKFTTKDYSSVYLSMVAELKKIMKHVYHGPKLTQQLCEWAAEGWAQSCKLDWQGRIKASSFAGHA